MKAKRCFVLLVLFSILKFNSRAQCIVSIPPAAIIINQDTTLGMVNGIYWVCSGDTLNGSGFHNTYFVESGGALSMSGVEKVVYLKSGASINCSGIDDTIYYEAGAIISCSGIPVTVLCNQVIFDYTNAPQGGCVTTGFPVQAVDENKISASPNPVTEKTTLQFYLQKNEKVSVLIYDITGKIVKEFKDQNFSQGKNLFLIDMKEMKSGLYVLELKSSQNAKRIKLIKNKLH